MYDEELIDEIVERLAELGRPFVRDVEEHYAGYFDELALMVTLVPETTAEDFEALATKSLAYLNHLLPKGTGKFPWILTFHHSLEKVGLFFPGNDISQNLAKPNKQLQQTAFSLREKVPSAQPRRQLS